MSINEKLAVDVMGALKGFRMEARRDEYGNFTQVPTHATYALPGGKVILQSDWNPTADLNQLKMCYEALSDEEKRQWLEILESLLSEELGWVGYDDVATAWVKHPELVAQAILKAKGVSL